VNAVALMALLETLASDVGTLRRRLADSDRDFFLADRLAGHVETLYGWFLPTAAELYRDNVAAGADEDAALQAALSVAEGRRRRLLALLSDVAEKRRVDELHRRHAREAEVEAAAA
jgi:hypothetical protein